MFATKVNENKITENLPNQFMKIRQKNARYIHDI